MEDPKKCSMTDCNKPLGPDALEFTHKGEPAGGICENCLSDEGAVRVLFKIGGGGILYPEEMVTLPGL